MSDFEKLLDDAVRDAVFAVAAATSGRGDFDRLASQAAASQAALIAAINALKVRAAIARATGEQPVYRGGA